LSLIHPQESSDKSKVYIYNEKARNELIKQIKLKPYLAEEAQ
jgi:hypothetical protein